MLPVEPLAPAPTTIRRVMVAEITCLLCARTIGTATADTWPPASPVLFQPIGSRTVRVVAAWWRVRCPDCGGNTVVSELVARTVRCESPADWSAERPRRGRPPNWLVAQRRAATALDEAFADTPDEG